jgi:AsmA-like C-terminal region
MSTSSDPATLKRRGRRKKLLLSFLAALVLLLAFAWFGIPGLLCSDWGREKVRAALSDSFGSPVEMASLEFGWSSGLTVRGFALGRGEDALRAKTLSADPELLSLLGDEMRLRKVTVDGLDLVIVRKADGTFFLPATESLRRKPPATAKKDGASPLAGLSVELGLTAVRLLVRDEVEGELLRFGPVSASAILAKGSDRIQIRVFSKEEGFDVAAGVDLLEDGRMREAPGAVGTLSFTGMDLARYARLTAVVGQTEGLEGRLTGTIGFEIAGADRQFAELDLIFGDAGAASVGIVGESRLTGKVKRTEDGIALSGFVLAAPGGGVEFGDVLLNGDRISARALLEAEPAKLRAALRGIDLPPGSVRKVELQLSAEIAGNDWSVRMEGGAASAPGRPLVEMLPGLGDRLTIVGSVAGDRELASVKIVEPLVLSAGPESVTLTGEIRNPKSDNREGRIQAALRGPLLMPTIASLREARVEGRAEGALVVTLGGGKAELSGELAVADLVVAKPGVPEIREPRVVIRPLASYAFADGAITVSSAVIDARGVNLSLTGPVAGLPANPSGTGKLLIRGDLARIRPFLPAKSGLAPVGTLRADLDLSGDGRQLRTTGTVTLAGLDLGDGRRIGDVRTTVNTIYRAAEKVLDIGLLHVESAPATVDFSGEISLAAETGSVTGMAKLMSDLARIPAGLLPAGFAGRGVVRMNLDLADPTRGRVAVTGKGLVLTGVPGIPGTVREDQLVSEAILLWPQGAKLPRLGDGRIEVPAGTVVWTGILDLAGSSELTADAALKLPGFVRDHAGLFPEGLAASGLANAKFSVKGDLSKSPVLDGLRGRAQVDLTRAAWPGYEVTAGTFALTLDQKRVRITKGEALLNGGPATIGGGADLGAEPIRLEFTVDTRDVKLTRTMEPDAKYLVPLFGNATQLSGLLDLKTDLRTSGADKDALLKGLTGTASLKVNDGLIRGSPILSAILAWLGEPQDLKFTNLGGNLRFESGRVGTDDLILSAANVTIRLRGFTGFDGSLDYKIGVKLPASSDRARRFQAVLGGDGFIPIGLGGTFTAPKLKPPDIEDMAGSALEGLLKKKLGDLSKPK